MLAIDLGRRVGISAFDTSGRLLRCGCAATVKREGWKHHAHTTLYGYPDTVLKSGSNQTPPEWIRRRFVHEGEVVTHLVIEGPGKMGHAFRAAVQSSSAGTHEVEVLDVQATEWREVLLDAEERSTGSRAKETSRWIARQLLSDLAPDGSDAQAMGRARGANGAIDHNAAESVLIGTFVASQKLGWLSSRKPLVRRDARGMVALHGSIASAAQRVALAHADGIGAVVQLLRTAMARGAAEVAEAAVARLGSEQSLLLHGEARARAAVHVEAIPILAGVVRTGSARAKEHAALALRRIALVAELRRAVAEGLMGAGVIPMLEGLVAGGGQVEGGIRGEMASSSPTTEALAAARALEHLLKHCRAELA